MSKSFTGDKNLDIEILLHLSDFELGPVFRVNKYINTICESEIFWLKRVIRRIEIAKDNMIRIDNKIKENIIDINSENLKTFREFYGFNTYKEINEFFNKFLPNTSYQLFFVAMAGERSKTDECVESWYAINKKKLPMYIDYEKLIQHLRRERQISYYNLDNDGNDRIVKKPHLPKKIPGIKYKKKEQVIPKENMVYGRKLEIIRLSYIFGER